VPAWPEVSRGCWRSCSGRPCIPVWRRCQHLCTAEGGPVIHREAVSSSHRCAGERSGMFCSSSLDGCVYPIPHPATAPLSAPQPAAPTPQDPRATAADAFGRRWRRSRREHDAAVSYGAAIAASMTAHSGFLVTAGQWMLNVQHHFACSAVAAGSLADRLGRRRSCLDRYRLGRCDVPARRPGTSMAVVVAHRRSRGASRAVLAFGSGSAGPTPQREARRWPSGSSAPPSVPAGDRPVGRRRTGAATGWRRSSFWCRNIGGRLGVRDPAPEPAPVPPLSTRRDW